MESMVSLTKIIKYSEVISLFRGVYEAILERTPFFPLQYSVQQLSFSLNNLFYFKDETLTAKIIWNSFDFSKLSVAKLQLNIGTISRYQHFLTLLLRLYRNSSRKKTSLTVSLYCTVRTQYYFQTGHKSDNCKYRACSCGLS